MLLHIASRFNNKLIFVGSPVLNDKSSSSDLFFIYLPHPDNCHCPDVCTLYAETTCSKTKFAPLFGFFFLYVIITYYFLVIEI